MSSENVERIRKQSEETDLSYINESIIKLSQTLSDAKWSTQPRILLELSIVKLAGDQIGFSSVPSQSYVKSVDVKVASAGKAEGSIEAKREKSAISGIDYDRLWHAIFEDGESLKGSFNLLRVGTKLKEVSDSRFIVEASNEMTMAYAMENASDLESLMEKHAGKRLRMECIVCDSEGSREAEKTAEDLANEIGNKFGIHIDIQ